MTGRQDLPTVRSGPLLYGGDYNPEQWPAPLVAEDLRLLAGAGVNTLTVNVFSWALLQPAEDRYDFSGLDRIVEAASAAGMSLVMGTSTAAVPPWMAKRHPDVCRVDIQGRRRRHGVRENACLTSPTYRRYAPALAGKLAERYADRDNLICWHVSNEYINWCYCDGCAAEFRRWLEARYGDIGTLNEAWAANFWSHTYHDFDEINPPSEISDDDRGIVALPGMALDFKRFTSDTVLASYRSEKRAIRQHDPDTPVTTNLMVPFRDYDYATWADDLDVIAWDSYPGVDEPAAKIGMRHDLARGLKDGGPFLLMEQSPGRQAITRAGKRPGQMREQSWQAVAHGAEAVMFFQMRQSRGGSEQFHGAIIGPDGTDRPRNFRAVADLGGELARIGARLRGSRVVAEVAVVHDWESRWTLDGIAGPESHPDHHDEVYRFYEALSRRGVAIDVVPAGRPLDAYRLVVAPALFLTRPATAAILRAYVAGGGRLVLTTLSGQLDESGRIQQGEAPVPFRDLAGVWEEELCTFPPGGTATARFDGDGAEFTGRWMSGLIVPDPDTEVLARFTVNPYSPGAPAVTRHSFGAGETFFVATLPDRAGADRVVEEALRGLAVAQHPMPEGTETTVRVGPDGTRHRFYLNGTTEPSTVPVAAAGTDLLTGQRVAGRLTLDAYGVAIVRED